MSAPEIVVVAGAIVGAFAALGALIGLCLVIWSSR